MAQYATQAQLATYVGAGTALPVGAEQDRLLQRASTRLDYVLNSWRYRVDVNDNPTDAVVITAFQNAVCAQVEYWLNNQDELGQLLEFESFSFEGVAVSRGGAVRDVLCQRARDELSSVAGQFLSPGILA